MGSVSRSFSFEDMRTDFDALIENFRDLRAKVGKGAAIESTKLWAYRRKLNSIEQLDAVDAAALIGIVNKYCALNVLFGENSRINVSGQKLLDLLAGKDILDDEDERYNDAFFELAIALRFAKSMGDEADIDLSSECDVVVRNQGVAIECKYLHSEKKFRAEFSDAMNQLDVRLADGQAKVGIVAYDLSNLVDRAEIGEFARKIFDSFVGNYERLIQSRSVFANGIAERGVLGAILEDRNFKEVVNRFSAHQAEMVFYRNFKQSEVDRLTDEKVAVVFQFNHCICFEYQDERIPVPIRTSCYYIHHGLSEARYFDVKQLIHSLAVGN